MKRYENIREIYLAKKRVYRTHPHDLFDFLLSLGIDEHIKHSYLLSREMLYKLAVAKIEKGAARQFLDWRQ